MKTKLFFTIAFLLFFNLSFSQLGENFSYATSGTDGTDYFVLIEKVTDSSKEVWVKKINPTKTVKNKKGNYIKTGGGHSMTFIIIDCSEKKYDIKERIAYDRNGKVIRNDDFPVYENRIVPGSVMSGIYNFVCNTVE
jgi:hypothetical protein